MSWYTHTYVPIFSTSGEIPATNKPWVLDYDIDEWASNLVEIDHLFFRQISPDIYFKLLQTPGRVEHGGGYLPLKILLDYCHWFRTVP